jgi:CheY-like chemotaxis protein
MAGLGGTGVLRRLRAELPDIRALVMSAEESPESVLHTVGAGAAGHLSKGTRPARSCAGRSSPSTAVGSVVTPARAAHLLRGYSSAGRDGLAARPLLAPREPEIVRLVADGRTDKEIGEKLHITRGPCRPPHANPARRRLVARKRAVIDRKGCTTFGGTPGPAVVVESDSRKLLASAVASRKRSRARAVGCHAGSTRLPREPAPLLQPMRRRENGRPAADRSPHAAADPGCRRDLAQA